GAWARASTRPETCPAAHQGGGGGGGRLPPGNGAARAREQRGRPADVAAGYCRLPRPDHRDRFAHADASGDDGGDRTADVAPRRPAQPRRPDAPEWLRLVSSARPDLHHGAPWLPPPMQRGAPPAIRGASSA